MRCGFGPPISSQKPDVPSEENQPPSDRSSGRGGGELAARERDRGRQEGLEPRKGRVRGKRRLFRGSAFRTCFLRVVPERKRKKEKKKQLSTTSRPRPETAYKAILSLSAPELEISCCPVQPTLGTMTRCIGGHLACVKGIGRIKKTSPCKFRQN